MSDRIHSFACCGFQETRLTRRHLLKVGGLGLLGLTMPGLLRAEEWVKGKGPKPRAKSVVFLYQFGGPSHIDMFDMKPGAPEGIRGPHKPMSTSADGIQVNDRLPRLAKVMDKVTLIRSMHHTMKNHNSASYYALSGHAPPNTKLKNVPPAKKRKGDKNKAKVEGTPPFAKQSLSGDGWTKASEKASEMYQAVK